VENTRILKKRFYKEGKQMEAKQTFNDVAVEYDNFRPSYPKELFEDVIRFSDIKKNAKILEIGCGTGQATKGFIDEGFNNITCIELGDQLANIARKKFEHEKNLKVYNSSFEEWEGQASYFDLAISATAFHFIEPQIGYRKVANLLKENGTTAFFWTIHVASYEGVFNEIRNAYYKYAPKLNDANLPTPEEEIEKRINIMKSTEILKEVEVKRYLWKDTYTGEEYVALLNTHSKHRLLPDEDREILFSEIKQSIDNHGGTIEKQQMVVLYLAKIQ
jgi:ubiquinone/menaquinone biosynthesis C-methylase UbiE